MKNKWVNEHEKNSIKSKEVVRSWSKSKSKHSIQIKQHRSKRLFRFGKVQKVFCEAHVNIHHNGTFEAIHKIYFLQKGMETKVREIYYSQVL